MRTKFIKLLYFNFNYCKLPELAGRFTAFKKPNLNFCFLTYHANWKLTILQQKLKTQFGICGTPSELLKNFLSERQQYLDFEGEISEFANVTCGIPRRSLLGPLLFLLYLNNLPTITNFDTTLFADDIYLQITISDQNLLVFQNRVSIKNKLLVEKEQARIKLRKNQLHSDL